MSMKGTDAKEYKLHIMECFNVKGSHESIILIQISNVIITDPSYQWSNIRDKIIFLLIPLYLFAVHG